MLNQPLLLAALTLFFLISSLNLYLQTEHSAKAIKLKHISKALLMPSLLAVLIAGKFSPLLAFALVFSCLGDIFLIGRTDKHFLLGLISFLIAHLGYCAYFVSLIDVSSALSLATLGLGMVIAWYAIILFKGVAPKRLIRFGMPVYMLVIGAMILLGMVHFMQKTDLASGIMLLGALLFGSSDSVLAFRRIKGVKLLPESYVMFSYISGQFLIVLSQLL